MGFFQNAELITTFHGVDMKPTELKKNRRRYQNIFQQNVRLTTNNPYGKELIQKIKPNYENISILPVGLDTEYFKGKIKNQNFTVLFCGRFVEFKAAVLIPEIAEYLKKDGQLNDTQFVLIGSGSQDRKIRKLVKNYKLQNHFKMLGDLTQDQVKKEMQKASVFLMPGIVESSGRAETQGLVIQEAQAMQVPVLVSDAGGMKYGMSNSKTGYVIPENDIAGYAEKIKFFKDNPEKRKQMGKAAREYVLKNFDSKVLGKQLEKIYREAL
jgi:colanic acid/amylovoran biosynthesis glycosyltransferase